jgi:hypothetical protein
MYHRIPSETLRILILYCSILDRLFGLVGRVPGYKSRVPGSIPGAAIFSEKYWVWNGVHSDG